MSYTPDMIVNSENSLPGRTRTHWQFNMSAGASYKLGHRVSLSIEPIFKYYTNSAYENSTDQPERNRFQGSINIPYGALTGRLGSFGLYGRYKVFAIGHPQKPG